MTGTDARHARHVHGPHSVEVAQLIETLDTDTTVGLRSDEASARLAAYGPNALASAPPPSRLARVVAQFRDPLVVLLLVAVAISLVAWSAEGADSVPYEAIVIVVIVALNAGIGLWQEAKAEAAVAALQDMAAPTAHVVRDGVRRDIPAAQVVSGDVVVLEEGDAVPADVRLVDAANLRTAEASLTGESEPVLKRLGPLPVETPVADRANTVFFGTLVTAGSGTGVVTSTGMSTEIGQIATLLDATVDAPTPLQREIDHIGKLLGAAVVAIAVLVIGSILATSEVSSVDELVDVLLVGVSLAVAAVPEGLPAVLAVVLAIGVQRMAQQRAIVKNLASVETLGSASVICSDKTGTLTKNEMSIQRVATPSGAAHVTTSTDGRSASLSVDDRFDTDAVIAEATRVISGGCLASDASISDEGGLVGMGDPTEVAFLLAEERLGGAATRRERYDRLGKLPFSSDRRLMSSLDLDHRDSSRVLTTKGAPDELVRRCNRVRVGNETYELDDHRRLDLTAAIDELADDALRTLAVADRTVDEPIDPHDLGPSVEHDLTYLGTVGMIDPARPEARLAVEEAQAAGIRVVMITGDHPRTAARIAEHLGIASEPATVVTGTELDRLSGPAFDEAVSSTAVFARVAPEHKLRIVEALQDQRQIVAMTGDGVNDAPALKTADIGVAMGITGTQVSKEAARMILADDNFATIVAAVREGRSIFTSIRKFLRYLLSSNTGEVLVMLLGVLGAGLIGLDEQSAALAVPLVATQILWINLLTDAAPALALGVDPPIGDPMAAPPRQLSDRVIDAEMLVGILLTGLTMAVATLVALDLSLEGGLLGGDDDLRRAQTVAFTTLVFAQLFNAFNSRSARRSALVGLGRNRLLWGAVALSLLLQVLVVHLPVLNDAFSTTGLTLGEWARCAVLGATVLLVDEVKKLVVRSRRPTVD